MEEDGDLAKAGKVEVGEVNEAGKVDSNMNKEKTRKKTRRRISKKVKMMSM